MTFLFLASTLRDTGALEVLKTGNPRTAAPENDDFSRPEGAAIRVAVSADTAVAAMAVDRMQLTHSRIGNTKATNKKPLGNGGAARDFYSCTGRKDRERALRRVPPTCGAAASLVPMTGLVWISAPCDAIFSPALVHAATLAVRSERMVEIDQLYLGLGSRNYRSRSLSRLPPRNHPLLPNHH